ncbi:hypothetical protein Ga0074812_12472 [Parafrankia irregularis]|uniref:DUF4386 family protein n=1 Tax=Parafrankia irregularis TaxID=795642 RepID=A0A0S4QTU4_9ACTN|nr:MULTISPECIES: hypothetical protein [Parafrankia]MBE3203710.1 hypothetical protein [Parafrankia sp. CH37]CUU59047.1 hypothetical protein Ga0074812_12472 [Parafrankia irregularis]
MTTTTAQVTRGYRDDVDAGTPTRARWTWLGVGAGVLGIVATMFTSPNVGTEQVGPDALAKLSRGQLQLGGALGYATVVLLLVLAASWRAKAVTAARGAVAARVAADGLTASAAALSLGYGWKLALALYLPGGLNENGFNTDGQFVYFMLNDFGPFIGYLGVVVAAGAVAWLGLRDRLVSRWLGLVSLIPPVAVLFMSGALSIAGFPGIVGPIWLIVAFAGLSLGKHPILGTARA